MTTGEPQGIYFTVSFFGFLKFGIGLSWTRISFMAQAGPVVASGGIGYTNERGFGADFGVRVHSESSDRQRQLHENTDSARDEQTRIKKEFEEQRSKMEAEKEELKAANQKMKAENQKMKAENQKMKAVNQAYINFLINLNSSGKQMKDGHCLVIFGLVDIDDDVLNDVVFILRKLNPSLKRSDLDFAFRFGVYKERKQQRPVIVQISKTSVRQTVLDNTHILTGSGVEIKDDVQINVFFDD